MLLSLGRAMAPAMVALSLFADGLLAENGRALATQGGASLALDLQIEADGLPLAAEAGDGLTTESGDAIICDAPAAVALESGGALIAENDIPLILE